LPTARIIGKGEGEDGQRVEMCGIREKCENGEGGDGGREVGKGEEWTGEKLGRNPVHSGNS
jgi:hypothetical protein